MSANLEKKKVLITGASGSLGRQLAYELTRRGIKPVCHVRETSDTTYLESLGLQLRPADLRLSKNLAEICEGIDHVIHCAAWVDFRKDRLTQFTGINVFGAVEMYKAAMKAGVKRFLHVSSVAAIGATSRKSGNRRGSDILEPLDESTEFNLDHLRIPYIQTKHAAETELYKIYDSSKTELVIVNPSIIIAPSRKEDDRAAAIRKFFRSFILPEFSNVINLVDLRDCGQGVLAALEKGCDGQRYIIGGDNLSARDLLLAASTVLGKVPHLVRIPRQILKLIARTSLLKGNVIGGGRIELYPELLKTLKYDWAFTSKKARTELGYHTRSIHATLHDLLATDFHGTWKHPERRGVGRQPT